MLTLLLALQAAAPAPTCAPSWPRPKIYWDSAGNRDATLAHLSEAAKAAPKDGEAWLAYGLFLTITTTEQTSDWRERVDAEDALLRAYRLLDGDPRPTAVLAVLRRKQGARIDSRRLIRRALGMVQRGDAALDACYEAELYYQMAVIYRTWWEDWEGMTFRGADVGSLKACTGRAPRQQGEPLEVTCPEAFYDAMSHQADLTSMRYDDRDAMIESLEAAVRAYPGHRDAQHALLLALYELEDWGRFGQVLQTALAADSMDPWLPLWGATQAFARRDIGGSSAFLEDALRLLAPAERAVLLSPERLVPPKMGQRWEAQYDSVYWRASDPLYLTDANERLLAHVARVTYAAAKYDVPLAGGLGLDTDAGFLLVRYGRPWRRWVISTQMGAFPIAMREVIWAMDSTTVPIRMQRPLTMRRWRFTEVSEPMIRALAAEIPERWDPGEVFDRFDSLPVEVARFEEDGKDVLDVYALWRNPYTDTEPDSIHMGFFVHSTMMQPLIDRRRVVPARREELRLKFRAPLSPAQYWYRVETLTGPLRAAGRARGLVDVRPPEADSIRTSDLLLGRSSRDPAATILHRDNLAIDPLYDLELVAGDSLVMYWETYGLRPDSSGAVRYTVTVDAREADRGTVADLVARLGAAVGIGRRSGLTVSWDVDAAAPDGVRRDLVVVDPRGWQPGTYVLRVRIEERSTGRIALSERKVVMVPERR